ncbi:glycosyltransferase [bacterium]|nr:glycosyltransferase [bacterium]
MKILYISPQHVSGTLDLWKAEHERRGNICRFVTLMPTPFGFKEDICLNLPLHPDKSWIKDIRNHLYKITRGPLGEDTPILQKPPFRQGDGVLPDLFFKFRDLVIAPRVLDAIRKYKLDEFDIIHLDQGAGFFRNARVIRRWKEQGKHIVAFYHGSDMRNRGIFPNIDKLLSLRLTSEVDLLHLDERLRYLFLPFDTSKWTPANRIPKNDAKIRIVHAARVRSFKGTDKIIGVVERLKKRHPIEFSLIENVSHDDAMKMKLSADIAIDQIADTGGWGYGMSSVEYLSLGIPTCTSMVPEMIDFIPDHPFIAVTPNSLEEELEKLVKDETFRIKKGLEGRTWVEKYHDIKSVGDQLYEYYAEIGAIS